MARRHATQEGEAELDITSMLDMIFILLIFFIVTTSFVRPPGAVVEQPKAVTAHVLRSSILIAVTSSGQVWMNKEQIKLNQIPGLVEAARAQAPKGNVVIVADRRASTGLVVKVMGEAKLGGATQVSLAAKIKSVGGS